MIRVAVCVLGLAFLAYGELSEIRNEPNLEKRAELALQNAQKMFQEAKAAYAEQKVEEAGRALKEMQASVELARDSLDATGKNPRKKPKYFKMGEKETQNLLRRLDGLENAMDLNDRKMIEGPKAKVQEVHDQWLNDIISGKK